jgi:3-hydroxypropanoate dehydrogenase
MTLSPANTDAAPLAQLTLPEDAQRRLFLDARSATHFAPRPVPVGVIKEVYEWVRWGPTGYNTSPLRIAVAASDAARARVISHSNDNNRPKMQRAPLLLVAAMDERYHDLSWVTAPHHDGYQQEMEGRVEHRKASARGNGLMQLGYLIVGLRAAGLAVRPMGGYDHAALDADVLAGHAWRSEVVLGVGYAVAASEDDGAGPRRPRLTFEQAAIVL